MKPVSGSKPSMMPYHFSIVGTRSSAVIFLKSNDSVDPLMSDLISWNISSLAFCAGVSPLNLGEMAAR